MHACMPSYIQLFVTPWTVSCQAPLSTENFGQEYWCGLPFPPPGDLPNPGIEPMSPTLQAGALLSEPPGKPYAQTDQKNRSTIWRFSNESQKHAALAWNQAADGGWWDGAARRTMRKMLPEGGERGLTCALAGWTGSRPAPCGKVQHSQGAQ